MSESEPLTASVRGSRLLGKGAEPGAGSGGSTSESEGQEEDDDDDAEEQARWSESRLSLSHSEEPLSTETRRSAPPPLRLQEASDWLAGWLVFLWLRSGWSGPVQMISKVFFSSMMSCQSDFCISSLNQFFRASMDARVICTHTEQPLLWQQKE